MFPELELKAGSKECLVLQTHGTTITISSSSFVTITVTSTISSIIGIIITNN